MDRKWSLTPWVGVPCMYISGYKYTVERMPEAFGAPRWESFFQKYYSKGFVFHFKSTRLFCFRNKINNYQLPLYLFVPRAINQNVWLIRIAGHIAIHCNSTVACSALEADVAIKDVSVNMLGSYKTKSDSSSILCLQHLDHPIYLFRY